jgi:hypothetical protein
MEISHTCRKLQKYATLMNLISMASGTKMLCFFLLLLSYSC